MLERLRKARFMAAKGMSDSDLTETLTWNAVVGFAVAWLIAGIGSQIGGRVGAVLLCGGFVWMVTACPLWMVHQHIVDLSVLFGLKGRRRGE